MDTVPPIIDIEASGFGPGSYPIEIGLVLPDGTSRCFFLKTEPDWTHWDPEAERLHGINRELLFTHGQDIRLIADRLNNILKDKTVYCDGWGNDQTWLSLLYTTAKKQPTFKLDHLRKLITEKQILFWEETRKHVTRELNLQRHRASNDAKILQQTLLRVQHQ